MIILITSIYAVPAKRSSGYMKVLLFYAIAIMGVALVMVLSFLWTRLISKKERAAKRYTEVKKQVHPVTSKKSVMFQN